MSVHGGSAESLSLLPPAKSRRSELSVNRYCELPLLVGSTIATPLDYGGTFSRDGCAASRTYWSVGQRGRGRFGRLSERAAVSTQLGRPALFHV